MPDSVIIQEQKGDTLNDASDDDMNEEEDDTNINMANAEKEAAVSFMPLQEALQKMKRQVRLQRRKVKQLQKDKKNKD
ncbi:hypothetical protein MAM1_0364c10059 [Mucor ambiguus]|uniref:Uncharacterized protein n=1 Tax=Mucor ambiguus TaxID=91626 RepID=A0A0C9N799_9FUNG|nr:hypothetical protein MAM1_0364c10059 [Mucor ambiguus]